MKKYNEKLISVFHPHPDHSTYHENIEIQILEFPDLASFEKYRSDPIHAELSSLREKGISRMTVYTSGNFINY